MVAIPGEEAAANPLADLGTEAGLSDSGAHFLLAPVRLDGEAPPGLLSQELTAATEPGRTMLDPGAHTGALKAATKTRLKMGITGR